MLEVQAEKVLEMYMEMGQVVEEVHIQKRIQLQLPLQMFTQLLSEWVVHWYLRQVVEEEMLEEILSEGDKALIFTQFAEMGKMLKQHLQETYTCEALFLHGGIPRKARDAMIQRFQSDHRGPSLFILSLKAGGLGLNLTAANHVFHFDRWWNPAVENQATDRAFRIGQKKNVQVHKFVCLGTVEERIDEMIEKKTTVAGQVPGMGEQWLTELSNNDLRSLIMLSQDAMGE